MQTAVHKAVRVGKATMLAIGLGVSLALVLGLATVALAAVPGDPFRLGQVNVIADATTTLRGDPPTSDGLLRLQRTGGIGAVLKVENNNAGGIAARGIDIKVPTNQIPIAVNPDAGKASGLNADKLDGKNSNEFLPNVTYVKKVSELGPGGGGIKVASVDCDSGDKLLGGGGETLSPAEDVTTASVPFIDKQGWDYQIRDNGSASFVDVFVVCADFPPAHQ